MKAGWKTVKLSDVCDIVKGRKPNLRPTPNKGDLPYLVARFIRGLEEPEYGSPTEKGVVTLTEDDTVIICDGSNSGEIFTDLNGIMSSTMGKVVKKTEIHDPYLRHFLASTFELFNGTKTGSAIPHLDKEAFRKLEIPLPPLAEQKRIVALLDEAFAGIDAISINAKTRSSEALCIFEQERDSFFANTDNKYTETTISDITTRLQYGTSEKSASTGRYVVLRMGNIQDGEIDYEDLKYTSSQEVIDQYSLKPGDVLFNRTNSPQWVGKSAIYRGEMPAVFAGYNIKVHTIADKIDSEFLTFFLNSDRAMSFGRSTFISSVNQANINAEKLRSYRLPLPPLREQKAIADRLGQIRKMSRALAAIYQNSLAQSEHLKAAILRSAFNGTL